MLRQARSMPTLKVLGSVVKNDIKQHSQAFSTAATKYHLVSPNIPDYKHDAFKYQTLTRSVHQTSKKDQTPLLNKKSEFSLMSLNTLKSECRKRGLKVSGRKADLVSRIATYESSYATQAAHAMSTQMRPKPVKKSPAAPAKSFSKSTKVEAKGDDSHIDFIKPVDMTPPKLVEDDYIVQIPSLSTDASKKAVTEMEKQISQASNPNETVVSKAPGSDIKIFDQGNLDAVEKQNADALETDVSAILPEAEVKEEPYEYEYTEVSGNDKKFMAGFLAAVGLWWIIPDGKKREAKKAAKKAAKEAEKK